jgi:Cof subfamily protein (haloacid dehalogenase superfamily)
MENNKTKKQNIQILFCDVDETLVVKNEVPEMNRKAIEKMRKEKNIKFVIATGRSVTLSEKIIKELDLYDKEHEYSICGSGSAIYENKNNRLLYVKQLKEDLFYKLYDLGKKFDIFILFIGLEYFYLYKPSETEIKRREFEKCKYKILDDDFDLTKLLKGEDKIIRICYGKENAFDYLSNIQKQIEENDDYKDYVDCFISSNQYLEINPKGVNKGEAVKWLCQYLNVKKENTMAIGDSYNDTSMIENVGFGCAVAGANEGLKKISQYVCEKDFTEGAVKEVIEKFLL